MSPQIVPLDLQHMVVIAADPVRVWQFVHDPVTAVLTSDEIVQGLRHRGLRASRWLRLHVENPSTFPSGLGPTQTGSR